MTIDIISFTDEQFAQLSEEQILEIENAQLEKNRLTQKLEEEKRTERFRLLKAGVFRSPVWEKICAELDWNYQQEVENIRDGLLFYLRFAFRPDSGDAPYPVDYSLTYEERLAAVKGYYEQTYPDAKERFAAFAQDQTAKNYLGEFYASLYELYAQQAETAG